MRAVVQRVSQASVMIADKKIAEIGKGLLVLLGVGRDDFDADVEYMIRKIAGLRIFADEKGKMNCSLSQVGGEILLVSQFTLFGDVRRGTRPSFQGAANAESGKNLYLEVLRGLRNRGCRVSEGRFQEMMAVSLVNDGPVTILLDSKKLF